MIAYIECDVPPGMTLEQWRRRRAGTHSRSGASRRWASGVLKRLRAGWAGLSAGHRDSGGRELVALDALSRPSAV